MPDTRRTVLSQERAWDLKRAVENAPGDPRLMAVVAAIPPGLVVVAKEDYAAIVAMADQNYEDWVEADQTIAGAMTDLRVLVGREEMKRRALVRDVERQRRHRGRTAKAA